MLIYRVTCFQALPLQKSLFYVTRSILLHVRALQYYKCIIIDELNARRPPDTNYFAQAQEKDSHQKKEL